MARKNRCEIIDESQVGIYHCTNRCVRRAFLCGFDAANQRDRGHRRKWLQERLVWLASRFSIDVISYSILGNHLHLVLRNRPDLVHQLTDEQVIRAWWSISPTYRKKDGSPGKISGKRLAKLLTDTKYLTERRRRLSSISWWMRYLTQSLAVSANSEDDVSGRFWEGRFFCEPVQSLEQLLSTMIYVDLNPIRAGLALTPEESRYCSVHDRLEGMKTALESSAEETMQLAPCEVMRQLADHWLSPIQLLETPQDREEADDDPSSTRESDLQATGMSTESRPATRASDLGVLPIPAEKYLQLVDWMGRIEREGKRGSIPADIPPILERLGLGTGEQWLKTYQTHTQRLDQIYRRLVNTEEEALLSGLTLLNPAKSLKDALA